MSESSRREKTLTNSFFSNQIFQEPGEQLNVASANEEFPIRIIKTAQGMDYICGKLTELDKRTSDDVYVGFDTEWKPPNPNHKNMTSMYASIVFPR